MQFEGFGQCSLRGWGDASHSRCILALVDVPDVSY